MAGMSVEIPRLNEITGKLAPDSLYWADVKTGLDEVGAAAADEARSAAGGFRRTGALQASISHQVNAVPAPRWVVVRVEATSRTGRRYPWILEFDAKYGHKNWLRDSIRKAQGQIESIMTRTAGLIERHWAS